MHVRAGAGAGSVACGGVEELWYWKAVVLVTAVQVLRGVPFNETSDLYRCARTLLLQLMMR